MKIRTKIPPDQRHDSAVWIFSILGFGIRSFPDPDPVIFTSHDTRSPRSAFYMNGQKVSPTFELGGGEPDDSVHDVLHTAGGEVTLLTCARRKDVAVEQVPSELLPMKARMSARPPQIDHSPPALADFFRDIF
jgi:hypothetical protein